MPRSADMIRFNALRNALYHTARRRSFERWNRVFNFAVVALGAAAIADLTKLIGISPVFLGAAVAMIGALQLVLDFGGAARTHQTLQREYYGLLGDIEEAEEATPDLLRHWEGKLMRITADEPPVLRALDAKAYNDAIDAVDWGEDQRLVLRWWHEVFSTVYPFDGMRFKTLAEVDAAKAKSLQPAE